MQLDMPLGWQQGELLWCTRRLLASQLQPGAHACCLPEGASPPVTHLGPRVGQGGGGP